MQWRNRRHRVAGTPPTSPPPVKTSSGGDAANEDASNKDTAVEAAQALIDALPEEVTAENADELQAQLMAIDEALAELSEEQAAGLDMTHYEKIARR